MRGPKNCQCNRHPDHPCTNDMNAEDFLCNICRPRCRLTALGMDIDLKLCCREDDHMLHCVVVGLNDTCVHVREILQVTVETKPVEPPKSNYDDAIRYMQNNMKDRPWTLPSGDIHYDQ